METQTPDTFKPCESQDLTAMTLPELIDFAIKVINDAPVGCFNEGLWLENTSDEHMQEKHPERNGWDRLFVLPGVRERYAEGARDVAAFRAGVKDPQHVRYCAVGAVLAADGARAALDWITTGATDGWKAGRFAGALFASLSNVFEAGNTKWKSNREALMALKIGLCLCFLQRIREGLAEHYDASAPNEIAAFYNFSDWVGREAHAATMAVRNAIATGEARDPSEWMEPTPEPAV